MRPLTLSATDGFPLAATLHEPEGPPRAFVALAPATAVPRTYYDAFGAFLARKGFLVLAFDYRGVGGSRPASLRGFDARMSDWAEKDLQGALAWAQKQHPDLPRFLVGHSVGGQLVGLARGAPELAGIVTIASQHGDWRLWARPKRYVRALQWYLAGPTLALLFGKLPAWVLGEELPKGVTLQWARWCRSPRFFARDDPDGVRARLHAVRGPWFALSFGDDEYGPHENTDALLAMYPNAQVRRRRVEARDVGAERVGHFGFFRPRFETTLWAEVEGWLRVQASA